MIIIIIFLIPFFLGVGITAVSLIFALRRRALLRKGAATLGTVIAVSDFRGRRYPTARFQTADGQIIDYRSNNIHVPGNYRVGDAIAVKYDPHSPRNVILGNQNSFLPWLRYLVPGSVGAILMLFSSVVLIAIIISPAPQKLPPYTMPSGNDGNAQTSNATGSGEFRECSERQQLKFIRAANAERVPLTVNNKSQAPVVVYLIGAGNYQSKFETIAPNRSQIFRSPQRGEWWMITDAATGKCKIIVSPPNVVEVK